MNKRELSDTLAERTGFTKGYAATVLDVVLTTITETVAAGGKVQISGFGSFESGTRAARTYNLGAGDTVEKPATVVPKFRPYDGFKASVQAAADFKAMLPVSDD